MRADLFGEIGSRYYSGKEVPLESFFDSKVVNISGIWRFWDSAKESRDLLRYSLDKPDSIAYLLLAKIIE